MNNHKAQDGAIEACQFQIKPHNRKHERPAGPHIYFPADPSISDTNPI
jgi:hypothetical protein